MIDFLMNNLLTLIIRRFRPFMLFHIIEVTIQFLLCIMRYHIIS